MGERIIKLLNSAVNMTALFCFGICILYGIYGILDSSRISHAADSTRYQKYQPDEKNKDNFADLQKLNPEVIGWIDIDGTNIHYPLAQSEDNKKYVDTNVEGEYAQSGCLFLDYRNKKDFSSLNNIIYGHHMEEGRMFGDIDRFLEQTFFDQHKTGQLYYNGEYHPLATLAIVRCSAYNKEIYDPNIETEERFQQLIESVTENAIYENDVAVYGNHLVLLSTCDTEQTDGRIVLVTKLIEKE